jgi:hypothetical protein
MTLPVGKRDLPTQNIRWPGKSLEAGPREKLLKTETEELEHELPNGIATPRSRDLSLSKPAWTSLLTRRNLSLTALALLIHISSIFLHISATKYTLSRSLAVYGPLDNVPPLRDTLHDLLPNTQAYRAIPELAHVLPVLTLAALILRNFDQRSLNAFRTFLWSHATLLLIRAACFSVTLLPDASGQCHASKFMGSCSDLIFSGHAMIMTLSILVAQHFFELPGWMKVVMWIYVGAVSILIIASRNHYSVDVLVGVVLAMGVFTGFARVPGLLWLTSVNAARTRAEEWVFTV